MDGGWITSPSARRVQQHATDTRPAWLWSADGQTLLWQNVAADLFLAKRKKHGLKLAAPAVPIKGQVSRNIRLGSLGRTSLARIQFLAGEKPVSATCATTPLAWENDQSALLIVAVDPIAEDIFAASRETNHFTTSDKSEQTATPTSAGPASDPDEHEPEPSVTFAEAQGDAEPALAEELAPEGDKPALETSPEAGVAETPLLHDEQHVREPSTDLDDSSVEASVAVAEAQGDIEPPLAEELALEDDAPEAEAAEVESASIQGPEEQAHTEAEPASPESELYEQELQNWRDAEADGSATYEPVAEVVGTDDIGESQPVEVEAPAGDLAGQETGGSRLSRLMDQLASDEALFTPLTAADDHFRATDNASEAASAQGEAIADPVHEVTDAKLDLAALGALDGTMEPAPSDLEVTTIAEAAGTEQASGPVAPSDVPEQPADPETVERVSRYNFDELSRILNDRVGDVAPVPAIVSETPRGGALISLGGETLVLNRLPLGILVFRDQQVLFANRAITEMVGYQSVEALREAGLAAVFPAAGPEGQEAGPVNHLVQRDGTLVPVTARLQSISWQGRPALMLSASATEVRTSHEAAVRAFAQTAAELRGDGFFEANRNGVLSAMTPRAAALLDANGPLEGKPLSVLVAPREVSALREFLERPARFAESERPYLAARTANGKAEIVLFAQGQAGIVTNYFGFVRGLEKAPARIAAPAEADAALLGRISRGVRRPLNTIIGFADLLRTQAFGGEKDRSIEGYAQDILTAGQDIAALVDELENFARLRDGRYLPQRSSLDLSALLESCVIRIKQQASSARVIVRNAIAENLPRVTADRASLEQAVLNLLASAIDQSPTGGAVVISAKHEDDGAISVHVRDSSNNAVDMAERFVVFRDGVGRDGQSLAPVRSSVGLALTRSLLAVNSFSLSVDPAGERGLLFTLLIPVDLVESQDTSGVAE